tara:strand:+ start:7738 stop:7983 length:246 start_codon:yes stop_codon:yes gene_type:complete
MKRVWRLSTQVLENNQSLFSTDYEENKKALDAVSEISSKKLRNQIAGCITKIKNNEQKALLVSQTTKSSTTSEVQTSDESD